MKSSFILIDIENRLIKKDFWTGCLLIFDKKSDAESHLSQLRPADRESTEIVERYMEFNKVEQGE